MATLTDYAPGVTSGRQATPGQSNPMGSVFASLSDGVSGLTSAFTQSKKNAWDEEVKDRTRKTWGEEDLTKTAQDEVAQLAMDEQQRRSDRLAAEAPDSALATPLQSLVPGLGEARIAAREIGKAKRAEAQGRLPQGSADITLEQRVAALFQKYPTMKAEISQSLRTEGIDHYMFEEYTRSYKSAANVAATKDQATKDAVKISVDAGLYDPSKSPEENAAIGIRYQRSVVVAKEDAERLKAATDAKKEGRLDSEYDITQAERDLRVSLIAPEQQKLSVSTSVFTGLVAAAGSDQEKIRLIAEQGPIAMQNLLVRKNTLLTHLRSVGASPELIKETEDMFEQTRVGMEYMLKGPLSQFEGMKRAVSILKDNFTIDNAKAFPILSRIGDAVGGPQAVIGMMDGIAALPASVQKDLAAELAGMQGKDAERGRVHLTNFVKIMRGQTEFADMSPEDARKILPGVVKATRTMATNIVAGKEDNPADIRAWMNTSGRLLNASVELQPGTARIGDVNFAISAVATPTTFLVLKRAMANPETAEDAKAFAYGSRGAAAQLLQTAKAVAPPSTKATVQGDQVFSSGKNKPWQHVVWSKEAARFVIVTDQEGLAAFKRSAAGTPSQRLDPVTGEWKDNPVVTNTDVNTLDPQLVQARDAFNNTTDYLVTTAQFDDSAPQGVSERALREHYGTGKTPKNAKGEPVLNSDAEFARQVDSFAQRTAADTKVVGADPILQPGGLPQRTKYEPIARETAERYEVPPEGLVALITQESEWIPNRQSDSEKSDAVGFGQFIKSTAAEYGLKDRTDPIASMDAAARYLRDLYKRHGSWEKALEAYGVIHPSNWPKGRDDPGYKKTKAKMLKAFEGNG